MPGIPLITIREVPVINGTTPCNANIYPEKYNTITVRYSNVLNLHNNGMICSNYFLAAPNIKNMHLPEATPGAHRTDYVA